MARYKINSKKSVAFLYSKDKKGEKEIRKITPITTVTNNIKYIGMTLTEQVKDLYDKNLNFTNPVSYSGLICKIYKELKKLDSRESNYPIKNGVCG